MFYFLLENATQGVPISFLFQGTSKIEHELQNEIELSNPRLKNGPLYFHENPSTPMSQSTAYSLINGTQAIPKQNVDHCGDAQVLAEAGDGRSDEGDPAQLGEDLRLRLQVRLEVREDGHRGHPG